MSESSVKGGVGLESSAQTRDRLVYFVREYTDRANATGVVVNLSGGIDSTVAATLAVEGLGADRVYGLILPSNKIGSAGAQDAEVIAESLGIDYEVIQLHPLVGHVAELTPDHVDFHGEPVVAGNLLARIRMAMAYLVANSMERLVLGTTNRSELLLGYFTKHGDGAADFLPIGHLYKTEVIQLARELDVPEFVIEKTSTAGSWAGQSDERDLGTSYDVVDAVLHRFVDVGHAVGTIQSDFNIDSETVERLVRYCEMTEHKRNRPPSPIRD